MTVGSDLVELVEGKELPSLDNRVTDSDEVKAKLKSAIYYSKEKKALKTSQSDCESFV